MVAQRCLLDHAHEELLLLQKVSACEVIKHH